MRGRRPISPQFYLAILEGFRRHPDSQREAAKFAGVDKKTAAKAWLTAWPSMGYRPVKDVLAEEQAAVRGLRQAAEERSAAAAVLEQARVEREALLADASAEAKARLVDVEREARRKLDEVDARCAARAAELTERARVDSLEQKADEATLAKAARKNVLVMHGVVAGALASARTLAARLAELANGVADATGKLRPLSVKEATELFRQLSRGVRELNQATHLAIQVERLRVGDPTVVVGVTAGSANMEEATALLAEAIGLMDVVKRRVPGAVPKAGTNGHSGGGTN